MTWRGEAPAVFRPGGVHGAQLRAMMEEGAQAVKLSGRRKWQKMSVGEVLR
jgi:hypothetical protein